MHRGFGKRDHFAEHADAERRERRRVGRAGRAAGPTHEDGRVAAERRPGKPAAVHRPRWKPDAAIHQRGAAIVFGFRDRAIAGCMDIAARYHRAAPLQNMHEAADDGGDTITTGPPRHRDDPLTDRPCRLDMVSEPRPLFRGSQEER